MNMTNIIAIGKGQFLILPTPSNEKDSTSQPQPSDA